MQLAVPVTQGSSVTPAGGCGPAYSASSRATTARRSTSALRRRSTASSIACAGEAGDLAQLADRLGAQPPALLADSLRPGVAQPAGDPGGDMHAGNILLEVAKRPQRQHGPDAGQDVAALVQPQISHPCHPASE